MKKENHERIVADSKTVAGNGVASRNPICHNISLAFSMLTLLMVLCMYGDKGPGGMEGMFYGLRYLFAAAIVLILSFVFAIIGFFRSEKAKAIHKINGALLMLFAVILFLFLTWP